MKICFQRTFIQSKHLVKTFHLGFIAEFQTMFACSCHLYLITLRIQFLFTKIKFYLLKSNANSQLNYVIYEIYLIYHFKCIPSVKSFEELVVWLDLNDIDEDKNI